MSTTSSAAGASATVASTLPDACDNALPFSPTEAGVRAFCVSACPDNQLTTLATATAKKKVEAVEPVPLEKKRALADINGLDDAAATAAVHKKAKVVARTSKRTRRTPTAGNDAHDQMIKARSSTVDAIAMLMESRAIGKSSLRSMQYPEEFVGVFKCKHRAKLNAGEGRNGKVYHLRGFHWVALTKMFYCDDSKKYKVLNYDVAADVLKELSHTTEAVEHA